ncbi:ABC transporter permease [Ureibacillus acetophenoni]|uniref:Transport permease protein n=1 Tax=Ureibacillus acetophenoni TaxID=614649 RepID=A0A285UMS2_9BACL|nr:ABC transporter permease [Ureibacillus acetophenoni]SOC43112.1 ABC-2 type transport system permease protein [Ureibacillus acetophenoni]
MQSILTHTKMEMKLFFRETLALLFTFIVPAVSFVVFAIMFQGSSYDGGLDYFQAYIPSMIAIIIFTTAFFSMGLQIVIDREKGVYKRLKGTPLNQRAIFTATIIKGFFAIYIGAIEILLIAKFGFSTNLTSHAFQFFLALTFCSVTFFSIGFIVSSLAKRMNTALGIAMIAMYPMMFLSGATIPLEAFPEILQNVSYIVPLTYVVNVLRDGWNGTLFTADALVDIGILTGVLIVSAIIGMKYFKWTD